MTPPVLDTRPPLPHGRSWTVRTARPGTSDVDLVHRWMNDPDVARFWNQAWSVGDWADELDRQLADDGDGTGPHSRPCIVEHDARPIAYLELYWAARHAIAGHYPADPHDVGVHIAIGEPTARGGGRGTALLRHVALGTVDAIPGCTRVLAEPDAANQVARRAFARAGYRELGEIDLPHKRAVLVAYTAGGAPRAASPTPGGSTPPSPGGA